MYKCTLLNKRKLTPSSRYFSVRMSKYDQTYSTCVALALLAALGAPSGGGGGWAVLAEGVLGRGGASSVLAAVSEHALVAAAASTVVKQGCLPHGWGQLAAQYAAVWVTIKSQLKMKSKYTNLKRLNNFRKNEASFLYARACTCCHLRGHCCSGAVFWGLWSCCREKAAFVLQLPSPLLHHLLLLQPH